MHPLNKSGQLLIWGGFECTINRVHDKTLDQVERCGFYDHPEWLEETIALGIKTIRFPILWEKHEPVKGNEIDWQFTEMQLNKLRLHNVTAVAGLLHHGSGPHHTNLLDPAFPELFAGYAAKVAAKFPWLEYYTPVNEPLTTARFSGLYGLWYPHKKNDVAFVQMLLHQLKATVLAMREIRKINPMAKLVQTEDLGKTYSTPLLNYQAAFENNRRWLTYDILCGQLKPGHSLWNYFIRLGIAKKELIFFVEHPCPPDIMGVNHYLTSERYLDDNIEKYPGHTVGNNGIHNYIDVEAVRIKFYEPHGLAILLAELWERYKLPVAITEVHLNCTREEQLRWFKNAFDIASRLRHAGINIIAVTAWALMGAYGWNKLLTCAADDCDYEPGAFDISAGYMRSTALASMIRLMCNNEVFAPAFLSQPGWWTTNQRYLHPGRLRESEEGHVSAQPIVIIGKENALAQGFANACMARNLKYFLLDAETLDTCNSSDIEAMLNRYHPWALINTASFPNPETVEADEGNCYRENYLSVQKLCILSQQYGIRLMTFSSAFVFNGKKNAAYDESDETDPLNVYGHSQQLAEVFCRNVNPSALIIRTGPLFGMGHPASFVFETIARLSSGPDVPAATGMMVSPSYIPHVVKNALDLLIDGEKAVWHLVNKGLVSWNEFARNIAVHGGFDPDHLRCPLPATTSLIPVNSALVSTKFNLMPTLHEGMQHFNLHHSPPVQLPVIIK